MAEIILSGLMVSVEKKQNKSLFLYPDEVAHHKDEWLLSLRTLRLMGWFNWVNLNLSQVEMETERKSMLSIYKSL